MAETLSRANFARLLGVNRSTVTRWAEAGRLVLTAGGRVEVEASRQRLAETSAGRDDVAARHAIERGAAIPTHQPATENAPAAATGGNARTTVAGAESRADAQARKEAAAADLLEIELAQKRGQVIQKGDVDAALKAFAASVRARLDVLADQMAPVVAPVVDLDEVHALLSEHARGVLAGVADDMHRQEVALAGVA
ncbi:MAG: hypothetical protein KJ787_13995 [Gammaproteobacteria bacterium]|nr:hypothetical protein [Gammaproteobacteria bacterium]MBU1647439.1 hypothetical protein [Gammaproteobacteria bacterium]MBU1973231.1 hypothetical protein [Gammaproteobacteria bacterium]